jgi:hypothetical protein
VHNPQEAGYDVVLGSTNGGKIPLDEASLSGDFLTEAAKKFQGDGVPPYAQAGHQAGQNSHGSTHQQVSSQKQSASLLEV